MHDWRTALTEPPCPQTGIEALDQLLPGVLGPGMVTVLGARPGIGKTLLAMQIADRVAQSRQQPVLIASLEMTDKNLCRRHVIRHAARAGTPLHDPYLWRDPRDEVAICAGIRDWGQRNYRVWPGGRGLGELLLGIRTTTEQIGQPSLIVVDYIQLLMSEAATREREIAQASTALTQLAVDLGVPLLMLAQLNRGPAAGGQHRAPVLTDLRDSGQIEQDADAVLLLHKPLPDRNLAPTGVGERAEIIIEKARHWILPANKIIPMVEKDLEWVPAGDAAINFGNSATTAPRTTAQSYARVSHPAYLEGVDRVRGVTDVGF